MNGLCVMLSFLIGLLCLAGCSPADRKDDLPPISGPAQLQQGQRLFAAHCASCHGPLARGGVTGPDLTASSFRYGKQRDRVVQSILDGRPGGMPAFAPHLSRAQAFSLADFLLQPQ